MVLLPCALQASEASVRFGVERCLGPIGAQVAQRLADGPTCVRDGLACEQNAGWEWSCAPCGDAQADLAQVHVKSKPWAENWSDPTGHPRDALKVSNLFREGKHTETCLCVVSAELRQYARCITA